VELVAFTGPVNTNRYGAFPLADAVIVPSVNPLQVTGVGAALSVTSFTVITVVAVSPHGPDIIYEIVKFPAPDTAGSNVPFTELIIPVPLHIPPAILAVRFIDADPTQNGPAELIVTAVPVSIVTVTDALAIHPLTSVPVTV
jgi:hypothetical protein